LRTAIGCVTPAFFLVMLNERTIRIIAFAIFFSVGAAVLSATTLCDDLLEYYYYKGLLTQSESRLKKLESLNTDYDTLLAQFEGNPKELARLAPATLGIEVNEPNTVYPRATVSKLAAARRALAEEPNKTTISQGTPPWICLACQWPRRHALFISGSILVLISFIFFGPISNPPRTMTVKSNSPEPSAPRSDLSSIAIATEEAKIQNTNPGPNPPAPNETPGQSSEQNKS
jgi:hypothetical protein